MAFPKRRRAENNSIVDAASVRRQDGNEDDNLRTNDDCQKQELQQEWHDLELDYCRLTVEQEKLQNWLEDLKTEEVALQEALDQLESAAARTDASGQSRRPKPSHEQAIDRLAQALFQEDEDDDDDSDDSDDSNDSNEGVKAP